MKANNKATYLADENILLDEVELLLLSRKDRLHKSILRVLAYEAQGFRIGLLFIFAFVTLSFFNKYIPTFISSAPSVQIMIFSLVCSSLIFADRLIFGRSRRLSREALMEAYSGDFETSKSLYRQAIRGFIPPPRDLYLLSLGEIFSLSGNMALGDRYIAEGMNHGASRRLSLFFALRSRLFSGKLSVEDLNYLQDEICKDPILESEMCWAYLARGEYSNARSLSRKILKQQSILHPSGIETRDLALLTESLSNLFLGKSEEATIDLEFSLKVLRAELNGIPNLVPYIALAYIIRSKYFMRRAATKLEGLGDRDRALRLCRYPLHRALLEI